jgi:hypothetical protein
LFDLEEEAFRGAAATAWSGPKGPLEGKGVSAAAERSRRTVRKGRRKARLADAPAVG